MPKTTWWATTTLIVWTWPNLIQGPGRDMSTSSCEESVSRLSQMLECNLICSETGHFCLHFWSATGADSTSQRSMCILKNWEYHFHQRCWINVVSTVSWGSWYDHVKGYWVEKEKRNILYLFYEDMKEVRRTHGPFCNIWTLIYYQSMLQKLLPSYLLPQNPRREVERIMRYLDLSISNEVISKIVELTSFKSMKENPMANYSCIPAPVFDHSISPFMRKGAAAVCSWS